MMWSNSIMSNTAEKSMHYCPSPAAETSTPWCFAGVLDRLEEGVLIVDPDHESIPYCNTAAGEVLTNLGLALDFDIILQFLESRNVDLKAIATHQTTSVFHNNFVVALNLTPLPDESIFIQIKDITEQKRLESIAETVNTMDNLGFIFSGIRHEIGNPLNSIKMTISVLQKNLEHFSKEDISRYIDRSASEITRMEYLLKSLRNFSMYEKVDCSPCDLGKFISTLHGLIAPDLKQKKIKVDCILPDDLIQVDIDPRALHQAMLNILTNAADAVRDSSDAEITITTEIESDQAQIIIRDNGCGMTEEQISMLFQPFYTNKPHGNGLGLVITRKLLTMMQASLDIQSRVNEGSTVRIGLTLTDCEQSKNIRTAP